ncbi:MAG: hypothetical protein QXP52_02245 [Candidatus Aenigmatarchaeota archaeon]
MGILKNIVTAPFKLVKKTGEKIKENKEDKYVKADFVEDMTIFLTSWGFDVKEASQLAEEFYQKHKNKILEII